MSEHLRIEQAGGVLTLTLNRPEKKNALTGALYQELADAIEGAADDRDARCILIQSEGDMFCAGTDLNERPGGDSFSRTEENPVANPLLKALAEAKTPIVAAVQGRAVGIGVTMLLHCDLVYLAENALLTTPFVNLGLVPEAASSLLLPARIGHVRAFSMFVLGEPVDAASALAWGLANAVVPLGDLRARALAAARAVAAKPPNAVSISKALMRDPAAVLGQMGREGLHFEAQLNSAEVAEALAAFAQKRPADFSKVP